MESVGRLMINLDFYKGKKVFITGHTGFKGTWLCEILTKAGAIITGYSINVQVYLNYLTWKKKLNQ